MPVQVTFNDRTPQAKHAIGDAIFAALKSHFQGTVLPLAQAGSPVRTGRNRASLIARAFFGASKHRGSPMAQIFSTSGYGGILELHTPYVWPAFQQSLSLLKLEIKTAIKNASGAEVAVVASRSVSADVTE